MFVKEFFCIFPCFFWQFLDCFCSNFDGQHSYVCNRFSE